MTLRILLLAALLATPLAAAADDLAEREALAAKLPGVSADDLRASPIPGLYEVMVGAQIVYVSADGRYLLNLAEELFLTPAGRTLDPAALAAAVQKRAPLYDKAQEGHYNLISALHKSMRGSDVDAALYWLARMLAGGEDPLYVMRRIVRFAA